MRRDQVLVFVAFAATLSCGVDATNAGGPAAHGAAVDVGAGTEDAADVTEIAVPDATASDDLLAPPEPDVAATDAAGPETTEPALPEHALDEAKALAADWLITRVAALADDAMEGRGNLGVGGAKARAWLEGELDALGLEPAGVSGWEQPFADGVNVLARLPGDDPLLASEVIVVGAHYDHLGMTWEADGCYYDETSDGICNGAQDNASGCALVLGVARVLTALAPPHRTVLFVFFDAEEDGLLGSRWFVDHEPLVPLTSIKAALIADSVGGHLLPGVEAAFALGAEYAPSLREPLAQLASALGVVSWTVSSFFDGSEDGDRSDHFPFRQRGIPALWFTSGTTPEYHTVQDELAVVDAGLLADEARHAALVTAMLASSAWAPPFVPEPSPSIDDARALAVLGDAVLADPEAAGLTRSRAPSVLPMLEEFVARLHGYVESPPKTAAEWAEYQEFVRMVIALVMLLQAR